MTFAQKLVLIAGLALFITSGCCCNGECIYTEYDIIECEETPDRHWDYEACDCVPD